MMHLPAKVYNVGFAVWVAIFMESAILPDFSSSLPDRGHSSAVPCRFVILVSGQGSNMQAIVQACREQGWPADIVAVIANREEAAGLAWARAQGIETACVPHRDYSSREAFDQALADVIDRYSPDYVLLAGFMRVLTPGFVRHFEHRLVNIHPSLLPAFPGLHTHAQALAKGVQAHGCTVHFVTPLLDSGPIIAQGAVPVLAGDTPESLAQRVLQVEHRIYPQVAYWLAEGRVEMGEAGRVDVQGVESRFFYGGDVQITGGQQ